MVRARLARRRRGTATVELAVVLALVLVPLLIGAWEMGRVAEFQQLASNAAREGARRASSGQVSTAQTAQVVFDYLRNASLPIDNAKVTIANVTAGNSVTYTSSASISAGSDYDLLTSNQNDRLRMIVEIPYADLRWSPLTPLYAASTLVGETSWYSLRDKDFPSLADPPIE